MVGAGKFGGKHLKTLIEMEKKGLLILAGVVDKTKQTQERLKRESDFPVYQTITDSVLADVDAVDIVTPPETHFELIRLCLKATNVLVEKPLAMTKHDAAVLKKQASSSPHILMVGHIYRFHPAVIKLKKVLEQIKEKALSIEGTLVNPAPEDGGRDVELELLHLFDITDYLFNKPVVAKFVQKKKRLRVVSLRYQGGLNGLFKIGWSGTDKMRSLKITFKGQIIVCDLIKNVITMYKNGVVQKHISCPGTTTPLEAEISTFLQAIRKKTTAYPDARIGYKIVDIATRATVKKPGASPKKKVAIIGGGIFGTNCAIELAKFCDVTIFEKNSSLLSEASFVNQYRHHWGYHYPRSQETVDDIRFAIRDFENLYQKAIVRNFPTYYSIAKEGSKVNAQEYVKFCDRNKLPYTVEHPDPAYLNRDKATTCLKTFEPIYDYLILKKIVRVLLKKRGVKIKFNSEVVGAKITNDGEKILSIKKAGDLTTEHFDYVVNVTYARHNQFCKWLGFPIKPIRLDLVEALWMKLDIPRISFAVMDGPFTNMVPTGRDNIFTLVHIKESILRRFVPRDGLVPKNIFTSSKKTNVKKIIEQSTKWLPIIKQAKYIRSYYVLRAVNAYREHDDARPSDIIEHGFGCLSILGGKIINSVTTAKKISELIS